MQTNLGRAGPLMLTNISALKTCPLDHHTGKHEPTRAGEAEQKIHKETMYENSANHGKLASHAANDKSVPGRQQKHKIPCRLSVSCGHSSSRIFTTMWSADRRSPSTQTLLMGVAGASGRPFNLTARSSSWAASRQWRPLPCVYTAGHEELAGPH